MAEVFITPLEELHLRIKASETMKTIFKEGDRVFVYGFGWGEYDEPSKTGNKLHYVIFTGHSRLTHIDFISFTEYTLKGVSQERPVTFEKDEAVAVSHRGKFWEIRYYSHDNECFNNGFTSKVSDETMKWQHIKKLTDFNK
jgi:hypothetical protein